MIKIKIKKGDTVAMRRGKDHGKTGKVIHVDARLARVTVEGVNLVKRHVRPRRQGEKGESVSVPRSVPLASVGLFCAKCNKPVRVGIRVEEKGRTRVCKRCGSAI